MGNESRIRAFIAIQFPSAVLAEIACIADRIRGLNLPLRWTPPENIHATLKFLGDTNVARLADIRRVMEESARNIGPFALKARGVGVFPGVKKPRILWVGLGGEIDRLIDIQRNLDHMLNVLGVEKEGRPFRGHLTLARIKSPIDSLALSGIIRRHGPFESAPFMVDRLGLFKSDLKPAGPVYTELGHVALRNPGAFSSYRGDS